MALRSCRTVRHSWGMELWTTERVREELGAKTIRSASRTLHRLGIEPVAREPGRRGMNQYEAAAVRAAIANRPGRGRRATTKELG